EARSRVGLYAHIPGLGGFAHHVLAVRLAAGVTGGPLRELLKAGGVASGSYVLRFGQAAVGGTRDFPVRGYRGGELLGERAATLSVEYRLPLALVGTPFGHLPFGADKLWLNLFGDAGDAWDAGQAPRLTRLRSAGAELAGDFTISYDFLLQVRLGVEAATIQVAKQQRNDPLIHCRLGFIAYRLGEVANSKAHYDDAAGEFEWAGELRPDWPYAWYGLGLAELAQGEHAVIAIENLRQQLGKDYLSK